MQKKSGKSGNGSGIGTGIGTRKVDKLDTPFKFWVMSLPYSILKAKINKKTTMFIYFKAMPGHVWYFS
jgi:hypothetical protein